MDKRIFAQQAANVGGESLADIVVYHAPDIGYLALAIKNDEVVYCTANDTPGETASFDARTSDASVFQEIKKHPVRVGPLVVAKDLTFKGSIDIKLGTSERNLTPAHTHFDPFTNPCPSPIT